MSTIGQRETQNRVVRFFQTGIATILTYMDNEFQTPEQRLSKTRDLKQRMMHQLLIGKTRLV